MNEPASGSVERDAPEISGAAPATMHPDVVRHG